MFRPGDRVRRVDGRFNGMEPGDIATIERFLDDGEHVVLTEFPGAGGHSLDYLELVSKPPLKVGVCVKIEGDANIYTLTWSDTAQGFCWADADWTESHAERGEGSTWNGYFSTLKELYDKCLEDTRDGYRYKLIP